MNSTSTSSNPLRAGMRSARTVQPCVLVIFGATGDLTHRKLLPALYNLAIEQPLPPQFSVVGVARRPFSDERVPPAGYGVDQPVLAAYAPSTPPSGKPSAKDSFTASHSSTTPMATRRWASYWTG